MTKSECKKKDAIEEAEEQDNYNSERTVKEQNSRDKLIHIQDSTEQEEYQYDRFTLTPDPLTLVKNRLKNQRAID